jgi:4,5-DOPA dioxygenase extradiol
MNAHRPQRMPAVFVGHGSPMNSIQRNRFTESWRELGRTPPKPRAILAVSAHWYISNTAVTAQSQPRTIHDFYGFPQELFAIQYPAPGDVAIAHRVRDVLAHDVDVKLDESWGIDHGAWSVLIHLYPNADVPVLQLSIDATKPPRFHYELGARLRALRDEGVLLLGSGNVVHNLRLIKWETDAPPYDWALEFDAHVRKSLLSRDHTSMIDYAATGRAAQLSVPTAEHYLPLLYVIGSQDENETAKIVGDGIDLASISMMSVQVG